jgi:GNAT superfamily N-acetyltransferase
VLIRRYEAGDREAVLRLHNEALHGAGAHAGNGPWDDDLNRIETEYFKDGGEFLVGVLDDRVVAMGAIRRTSAERAEVKRMRVEPALQGRGLGQTMLARLEQRAGELGYRALHLDTTVQQTAARGLYAKNGYREVRRGELAGFECVFYEKELVSHR